MQRYLLGVAPKNKAIDGILAPFAQHYFKNVEADYLLGHKALTHVTLGQFYLESKEQALSFYDAYQRKDKAQLHIGGYNIHKGMGSHDGFWWAEITVEKTADLIERQGLCVNLFQETYGKPIASPSKEEFSPHFTLARCKALPQKQPKSLPETLPQIIEGRLFIGRCSEIGRLEEIFV